MAIFFRTDRRLAVPHRDACDAVLPSRACRRCHRKEGYRPKMLYSILLLFMCPWSHRCAQQFRCAQHVSHFINRSRVSPCSQTLPDLPNRKTPVHPESPIPVIDRRPGTTSGCLALLASVPRTSSRGSSKPYNLEVLYSEPYR